VSAPSFCVIGQGSKEVLLGDNCYSYDSGHYLIATTALPIASRITEASDEFRYLSVLITIDPALISSVMIETGYVAPQSTATVKSPAYEILRQRRN
jgi:hypothetical protein